MAMGIARQVVLDPYFAEKFNIVRRAETVNAQGRTVVTPITTVNNVGVITMNEDIENIRIAFPEMEFATRVISVVTKKKLQAAVTGYQPDLVVWRGDNYLVQRVSPYPQFGSGFYEAICTSVDFMDAPI
jgi:hypothetical protein